MSVLRRVKLRTPDGTESIEYPLGVEAKNVEVANQENLSQRLVRIDEDLEENEEDIAAVSELAGTNKQNIGAAEIRIDALERRSASVDKKPYYFDAIADMKAYQGLEEGDMAITLGYYTANDGGGAEYKIVNGNYTDDGGSIHILENGLKAMLIYDDIINVKQFGAKGNGVTDDTACIKKAITYAKNNNCNLIAPSGFTFLISETLRFDCLNVDFNNSILKTNSAINMITIDSASFWGSVENIKLDCNSVATRGIYLVTGIKKTFRDISIINIANTGFEYLDGYEVVVDNLHLIGDGVSTNSIGLIATKGDSAFSNIIGIDCYTFIKNQGDNFYNNVHSWIKTRALCVGSTFAEIFGDGVFKGNFIYSDTYHYTFKWSQTRVPYILVSNSLFVWNDGIMNAETMGENIPYIFYNENASNDSCKTYLSSILNSEISGKQINSTPVQMTNENYFGGAITNCILYDCDNTKGQTLKALPTGITASVNRVRRITKELNCIDLVLAIDTSLISSRNLTIGELPWSLQAINPINTSGIYGTDEWNVTGIIYTYFSSTIQIVIPSAITGTIYYKLHLTYESRSM